MSASNSVQNHPPRPKKRIVLCSDGTGNAGGRTYDTNVWRIFDSLDITTTGKNEQIAFYDDGIGTESFKLFKVLGGMF